MSRVRPRLWLAGVIVSAGLVASGLVVGALAYAAEPPAPAVNFTAIGAPPIACGSRPDVSSLSVPEGTEVVIGNRIGVRARVVVGGETVLSVAADEGASLTLVPGQHAIRLVPECAVVAHTASVTVTVTANTQPTGPPAATTEAPAPPPAPPTPPAPRAAGPSSPVASGAPRTGRPGSAGATGGSAPAEPSLVTAATDADPSPHPSSAPRTTLVSPGSGIISAVALEGQDHPKGLRVLAAIATICVLGVTAAIIRAIVRLSP